MKVIHSTRSIKALQLKKLKQKLEKEKIHGLKRLTKARLNNTFINVFHIENFLTF